MTTLLTISTPLFIGIIVGLLALLITVFLLLLDKKALDKSEKFDNWVESKKQWTTVDMIDFAQSVSNNEITMYELNEWESHSSNKVRFSDN